MGKLKNYVQKKYHKLKSFRENTENKKKHGNWSKPCEKNTQNYLVRLIDNTVNLTQAINNSVFVNH